MSFAEALRSDRPLVIAHRGARSLAPENTLLAFAKAADVRADALELDVRLARSGEVVVLHDPELTRVTGGTDTRLAHDLTAKELAQVDVGEREAVPLLRDVLALAAERGLAVNVEMKRDVPDRSALVEAVAPMVKHAEVPIVVSSFDPVMMAWLGVIAPKVTRALLVHQSSYHELMAFAPPLIRTSGVHAEKVLLDEGRMRFWSGRDFVCAWTVNSANESRRLARLGVRGIITDDPAYVLRALSKGGIGE